MPRPANMISHADRIDRVYGLPGTPKRDAFDMEVELIVVGEAIKQARTAQGLSQTQLGERLGVGKAQVSKLENNLKDARLSTIQRVFEALGMKSTIKIELQAG